MAALLKDTIPAHKGRAWCTHLVNKDGAKVADDVDNAEDEAALGEHGQVGASQVAVHGEHVCHFVQVLPHLQEQHLISEAAVLSRHERHVHVHHHLNVLRTC